jgi:hypothetical protein
MVKKDASGIKSLYTILACQDVLSRFLRVARAAAGERSVNSGGCGKFWYPMTAQN